MGCPNCDRMRTELSRLAAERDQAIRERDQARQEVKVNAPVSEFMETERRKANLVYIMTGKQL